jgi:serine/threonine-protein kinase
LGLRAPPDSRRRVGRYSLFGEIARGGMATVHLGRKITERGLGAMVAVKALHAQYASDPDVVTMLLDEARVAARIDHPNVVPIVDLVSERGQLYIVMEYIEGVTLARLMAELRRRSMPLPYVLTLRIVCDTLKGLHAAHTATDEYGRPLKIIHRDVSPENILVGVDGVSRVIDFGVAQALGRATVTRVGVVKGKPTYMAPEQVLGEELGGFTDVYSASVVLWQALTGQRLFSGENLAELAFNILRRPVAPPSSLVPSLPTQLDAIVMRGLQRQPADRWPTAEAMARAIEGYAAPAHPRSVGDLVQQLACDQLAARAAMVRASDRVPRSSYLTAPESRISIASISDEPMAEEAAVNEPSRTRLSLTNEAGGDESRARPRARLSVAGLLAVAALVALVAAGLVGAWRERQAAREVAAPSSAEGDVAPAASAVDDAPEVEPKASAAPSESTTPPTIPEATAPDAEPQPDTTAKPATPYRPRGRNYVPNSL